MQLLAPGLRAFIPGLLLSLFLAACGSSGRRVSYNPGYGPFDENGNYVEAWADKPAKKHWWRRKPGKPSPKPAIAKAGASPASVPVARKKTVSKKTARPRPRKKVAARKKPRPRKKVAARKKPSPRKKAVVAKPRKRPPIRHVVSKGDTLYSIARLYRSSVSSIQKANRMNGTLIRNGTVILVPR